MLLLGGPGSGKTRRLAALIKEVVEGGGDPSEITFLTFTNEARDNMRRRLGDSDSKETFLSHDRRPSSVLTMHGFCHRLILQNAKQVGFSDGLRVIPRGRMGLYRTLLGDAAQLAGVERVIGVEAERCRKAGECAESDGKPCEVCRSYREILRACNCVDFDEQVMLACRILEGRRDVAGPLREAARWLFVDEYQDINAGQYRLIRCLSKGQEDGLTVAGDDDQSIYRFRGGSPEYIRQFARHYGSTCRIERLEACHRCPPDVIRGAMAMVGRFDPKRTEKALPRCYSRLDSKIQVWDVPSDKKEAELTAEIARRSWPSRDVLVLFPKWALAYGVAACLRRSGIPYTRSVSAHSSGLARLRSVAASLVDPSDSLALRETMQAVLEGAGLVPSPAARNAERRAERESSLHRVSALWTSVLAEGIPLDEALRAGAGGDELLEALAQRVDELREAHARGPAELLEVFARVIRPWTGVESMLSEVENWLNEAEVRHGPGVRLLTMHGAKGLQADVVVILGLDEGVFPAGQPSGAEFEEASRLLYVSMTRAKRELHLFHARTRDASISYIRKPALLKRSLFLGAIPREHTDFHSVGPST